MEYEIDKIKEIIKKLNCEKEAVKFSINSGKDKFVDYFIINKIIKEEGYEFVVDCIECVEKNGELSKYYKQIGRIDIVNMVGAKYKIIPRKEAEKMVILLKLGSN